MAADFGRRFEELSKQAKAIDAAKKMEEPVYGLAGYQVDPNTLLNWLVKVRHLISSVCGERSQHFLKLIESEKPSMYKTGHDTLQRVWAVLEAAQEDYTGGYLNSVRNLVQSDVFDSELEQATELLKSGYIAAAAVVSGVVLETTLRQMCDDNQIPTGKLDKMGADLAKSSIINKLIQKQITAWADIRNNAAHGNNAQFNGSDVEAMIRDVRRFVADRLT